jgi:hypothetical protein
MPSNEEIKEKARKFLEVVSNGVQSMENLKVVQKGLWWSAAEPDDSQVVVQSPGPTTLSKSGSHEREVFNWFGVGAFYQTQMIDNEFPEQSELHAAMLAVGIEAQWIRFGFLVPLVYAWCELPDPLDLAHSTAEELLDTFADAVVEHKSTTTYRDALVYVDLCGEPLVLEQGISLRPISEDELYELSQGKFPAEPYTIQFSPSDKWSILEIKIDHSFEDPGISGSVHSMREAIISGLVLAGVGGFILLPLGMETNFGTNTLGSSFYWSRLPREFGPQLPLLPSTLSSGTRETIVEMWPRVKEIMIPGSDYLALPLRRLVDGLGRTRLDDRIVDYSIGLEALLTNAVPDELSYRFALRGAIIRGETGHDRHQAFQEFKDLYGARSKIVHGGSTVKLDLRTLAANGETLLRHVWNWYFGQGMTLRGATARIDRQILSLDE